MIADGGQPEYHNVGIVMATSPYENALHLAELLSREEQLRLIQELTIRVGKEKVAPKETSLLELCGLGREIWQQIEAQEYVDRERSTWNG